jgi:sensor histidine kinase YesM
MQAFVTLVHLGYWIFNFRAPYMKWLGVTFVSFALFSYTSLNFDWVSRLLTEFSSLFHSLTDKGKQYMEAHDSGVLW